MKNETAEELRREKELILIWIRDVTAPKRARLNEIRSKLKGVLHLDHEKTNVRILAKRPDMQGIMQNSDEFRSGNNRRGAARAAGAPV